MTRAGGVDLPAEIAGLVALDEVVIHGWDVAVSSGQRFDYDSESLGACTVSCWSPLPPARSRCGTASSGRSSPVPDEAPLLDRVVGLTGRDPGWSPR